MKNMYSLLLIIIVIGIFLYFHFKRKNLVTTKKYESSPRKNYGQSFDNKEIRQPVKFDLDFERSDNKHGKYLVFDTETTGLPINRYARPEEYDNWPYVVQIAWYLFDDKGKIIEDKEYILRQNVKIPADATGIHGIDDHLMMQKGTDPKVVYSEFVEAVGRAKFLIAHNIAFDKPIIECELLRNGFDNKLLNVDTICTMETGKYFCALEGYAGDYKYPKLTELLHKCFFPDSPVFSIEGVNWLVGSSNKARKATIDASITAKCFFKLRELNIITETEPRIKDQKAEGELGRKSPVLRVDEVVYCHANKNNDVRSNDELTLDISGLTPGAPVPNTLRVLDSNGRVVGQIYDSFYMERHLKPILRGNRYKVLITSLDVESHLGHAQITIFKKGFKA